MSMNEFDVAARTVARLLFRPSDEHTAYLAGFACGRHGPSMVNCHFRYFATKELMQAWEVGKKAGELEKRTTAAPYGFGIPGSVPNGSGGV